MCPAPYTPSAEWSAEVQADVAAIVKGTHRRELPHAKLCRLTAHIANLVGHEPDNLAVSVPTKWEKYDDFVLFPENAFQGEAWQVFLEDRLPVGGDGSSGSERTIQVGELMFGAMVQVLRATHFAAKSSIPTSDVMRRPEIQPLYGNWGRWSVATAERGGGDQTDLSVHDNPTIHPDNTSGLPSDDCPRPVTVVAPDFDATYWARTKQNGVTCTWAPIHTMFCAGNISEKLRVAQSPLYRATDQTVVDLYAGVGYFTLPYLVHAGARTVHACEMNPWSVEGLRRGAVANRLSYRISGMQAPIYKDIQPRHHRTTAAGGEARLIIYPGNNADHVAHWAGVADHVNLGLLPSSTAGWPVAVRALRPEGGWLHVHVNRNVDELDAWLVWMQGRLLKLLRRYRSGACSGGGDQRSSWNVRVAHVERVKSYAPRVYHYVIDVECRPNGEVISSGSGSNSDGGSSMISDDEAFVADI
ncbi:S-adenosylmethionine-dependent methyltransferase [Tieghemiomyces parasiticus]|uniref:tRNA(Phe) (4-demethylwyosine(37)-C(7)) aminocarboxypropyltransferase n=1 Tax=Tieghemiomyces parasiticus TaxID=78921 RepID=A0A9W8DVD5_9FUNG|nr:S-adenosylmethionine-dependent methyltransferase [Tieghemiomyces parasiticus]